VAEISRFTITSHFWVAMIANVGQTPGSDDIDINCLAKFAQRLADAAGAAIRPYFRRAVGIDNKACGTDFDPVTEADRAAELAIRKLIIEAYPDHGVIGEEFEDRPGQGDFSWILDPIDGTRAFIMGLPMWGTLIGLSFKGKPILGLMDQPVTGERFWSAGDGAYYRGPDSARAMKTRVCPSLALAKLACTTPEMFKADNELARFQSLSRQVRLTRFGTDCYGYCLLAMGQIDLVVEAGLKPFDIAPLIPIIERAGGVVTGWDGGCATQGGRVVAAGDARLHEQALSVLSGC
jgi:histidinol phosphatase-like enzyme (inositol monophosphatase family)